MKKKLLTLAMAAVMTVSSAFAAFAEDVDCTGWWVAHSAGVEVTTDGVEVTFTNTTYESATANWNGPIWVLYSADEAFAGSGTCNTAAGYNEYWVMRGDNYGWGNNAYYNTQQETDPNTGAYVINTNTPNALADAGITWTADADATWDNFVTDLKSGIECKATAKLVGNTAEVTFSVAGVDTKIVLPVDTSKKTYLSIGGELTKITNLTSKSMAPAGGGDDATTAGNANDATTAGNANDATTAGTTGTATPNTGDATMVGLLLAVAAVSAVVVLKKRTVTE